MGILETIAGKKAEHLKEVRSRLPLRELMARFNDLPAARDFTAAVRRADGPVRLIAEVKRASPSRGIIREDFEASAIASIYEGRPVSAISVLTEADYFQGHLSHLGAVKLKTTKPVLRKDFIIDDYQIWEARIFGADAVLLIAGLLQRAQAKEYLHLAADLGLAVLFEIHDQRELEDALAVDAPIIDINNRDLKTLQVDLKTTFRLKREIPPNMIVVAESGIRRRTDVLSLQEWGVDAMLIGTSFMESHDISAKIDELLGLNMNG